jgi:hypothetical protein
VGGDTGRWGTIVGIVLVAILVASCASKAATSTPATPDPNAAANAATDRHVAATVARLGALSQASPGASGAADLTGMAAVLNVLEQERAWIAAHADPSRPSIKPYVDRILAGIDALTVALGEPTAANLKAAGDALAAVRAAGANVTGGD